MSALGKIALGIGLVCLPSWTRCEEWPQFRGPAGTGVSKEARLPVEWSTDKNVAWKVKIPGYGWSSPVVWGDKVFVTTAVSERQRAPQRRGPGGGPEAPPDEVFRWEVYCLDAATGKTLWHQVAAQRKPPIATHISNTYASETPVTDGERLYAYFGMIGVFCYDLSGKLLWSKDLGAYRMFGNWGTSSSPALDEGRLFVQCDNEEQSFLLALDAKTGNELWRVRRSERSTWGTPVVWRNRVRRELVAMGSRHIRSYDPASGKVLWELTTDEGAGRGGGGPGRGGKRAAGGCKSTPVATPDLIFVGMATTVPGQLLGPMWAVKAGASGNLSLRPGETSNSGIAWYRPDAGPHFASAVVYQDLLYVFAPHQGTLECFDAKTGADVYQKRLPGAGDFKSSPWAYDGKIFNVDENGVTFVVQAGPEYRLLGRNDLNELCWASPAPAHGVLFLRGVEYLYCLKP
ncbi:MAG: PQQ-binding-like beta-propeller repeat protein [Planctomycetes bacterium]|nr:PQQ-binding-like beta-propeller repeat protein [Planctomycetota bacterium]